MTGHGPTVADGGPIPGVDLTDRFRALLARLQDLEVALRDR
jgi:hypothetical protein